MKQVAFALIASAATILASSQSNAATAIQSFNGGTQFPFFTSDETVGFVFDTKSNLSVTSLGWYAADGSLVSSHQVGVWNASGVLLGSATVSADTTAGAVGFRYVSLSTPFTLASGERYFVGGRDTSTDNDNYLTSVSNLQTAPQITYVGSAVSPGNSGFAFPNIINSTTSGGRFGANLQFEDLGVSSAVPEPATWAMMLIGFGGIGGMMRRRKIAARIHFA